MALDPKLALFGGHTQNTRLLRLTTPAGAEQLLAECVRGVEGLDQGFRIEISALSHDAQIELKTLLGQPVLLELSTSEAGAMRSFHGHVTAIERVGANGGFARYQLVVEPWTAFLGLTRDSTTYQDMTVFDIVESVFGDYQGQGSLSPAWRFEIQDRSIYPRRSVTTQYQESDLAFVRRLLVEEGLFHWFEHAGDASAPGLGCHTLVIADHNGAFKPNVQHEIRFTQPGAVMREDSLDRWRGERRWQTNAVELQSWDYRTLGLRPSSSLGGASNSADDTRLALRDIPGQYNWENTAQGERLATNRMQAIDAANKTFTGAGTVRTLAPGTTFVLREHPDHDREADDSGRTFAVLRVHHLMSNNLGAQLQADVTECLGQCELAASDEPAWQGGTSADDGDASTAHPAKRPLYRNHIQALRVAVPYRPRIADSYGRLLHPRPTVNGQQSAIVVGAEGAVIHTDRDHRIKVQFHWQRGDKSQSRLPHPHPDGHTGAPANEGAGTWVRVATALAPIAGANWGGHSIPRVGQEVLVDFVEGDIDRPVVVGVLYNGRGRADAQHNDIVRGSGASTGNAPAWFAGTADAHAHGASLNGIKSQRVGSSAEGTGAYNQLVFDDSQGQSRTALQHHAQAHRGNAELNLGHLRHQTDNQRLATTGFGAELKTEHHAALRAGQGLLVSSDARREASSTQLDSREAQAQVEESLALQETLATLAQQHNARLKNDPDARDLPATAQLAHVIDVLKTTETGIGSEGKGGQGSVTAWSEPHLQFSSPAGIAATTPADAILAAGNSSVIAAGQDISTAAQGNSSHLVAQGISLFTYGKAQDAKKPNQETGIQLHAASGKVSTQSQSDQTKVTADKDVTVQGREVKVSAKKHALLTAMGAFIRIEGSNITLAAPGKVEFKAGMKEFAGPGNAQHAAPVLPKGELKGCQQKLKDAAASGMPFVTP